MNRRNINLFKRNLFEMVAPDPSGASNSSPIPNLPNYALDPTTYSTWDEYGYTQNSRPNRQSFNNTPPSQYGPSQNPTHDYPPPPNVPNGYLYWNPTLGRWELWEDLSNQGGGSLPRYRYNPDSGRWEPVSYR